MEVYLHCEGPNDHAVICPLMAKFAEGIKLSFTWIKRNELTGWVTHRKGDFSILKDNKLLTALAAMALTKDCKNIVYHQDADHHFKERYNSIRANFKPLEKGGFNCLAIVPKEMIESWLLADVKALNSLETVLKGLPSINQSPDPEALWGKKKNPNSDYPKNYLTRVLNKLGRDADSATYKEIAQKCDINVLKKRCPESFGQFYADIQIFLSKKANGNV
jgi:hypothetical protein